MNIDAEIVQEHEDEHFKYFRIKGKDIEQILTVVLEKSTNEYFMRADDQLANLLGYTSMDDAMLNDNVMDFYSNYKKINGKWPLKII